MTPVGQKRLNEIHFQSLDRHGILCLSTEPNSMVMWSYYAEGHKAVVVRFDMSVEQLALFGPQFVPVEVKYTTDFPLVSYYNTETQTMIAQVVGTKAKYVDWSQTSRQEVRSSARIVPV